MATQRQSAEGIILSKGPAAESYNRFFVFSKDAGLLHCMKRISRNPQQKAQPDLFDRALLELDAPTTGKVWFLRDYRLIHRPVTIGRHYQSLFYASKFARILRINLIHMESFQTAFRLFIEALKHWESGRLPQIVYLKTLYRYIRQEGYPIREDWLIRLPASLRDAATEILRLPLQEQGPEESGTEKIIESLEIWLIGHTDILV